MLIPDFSYHSIIGSILLTSALFFLLISNHRLRLKLREHQRKATTLITARDEAERANWAKSEFLANLTHEIRTPMNAIVGFSQLALKTGLNERQQAYLNRIERAARVLLGVTNQVLDFSKIEAGHLELEIVPFMLDLVLDSVYEINAPLAAEGGLIFRITVAPDVPLTLVGDPLRLGQVLINLVSNALKFTKHGEVSLLVENDAELAERTRIRFTVKDTGIGLNKDSLDRLFIPFMQAEGSTSRRFGGSGLGLAICQQLIKCMDSTIEVQSVYGQGSQFSFAVNFVIDTEYAAANAQLHSKLHHHLSYAKQQDDTWSCRQQASHL